MRGGTPQPPTSILKERESETREIGGWGKDRGTGGGRVKLLEFRPSAFYTFSYYICRKWVPV